MPAKTKTKSKLTSSQKMSIGVAKAWSDRKDQKISLVPMPWVTKKEPVNG